MADLFIHDIGFVFIIRFVRHALKIVSDFRHITKLLFSNIFIHYEENLLGINCQHFQLKWLGLSIHGLIAPFI